MNRVQRVTAQNFSRDVLLSPVPVVVDVYADWCGPCRAFAPSLENIADVYGDRIRFLKANIDTEQAIAEVYRVDAVPTLLFFRNGELIDRVAGIPPVQAMLRKLDSLIGTPLQSSRN